MTQIPPEIRDNLRLDIGHPPAKTIEELEKLNWHENEKGELETIYKDQVFKIQPLAHSKPTCYAIAKTMGMTYNLRG